VNLLPSALLAPLIVAMAVSAGCLSPLARKAKSVLHLPSGASIDQAGTVATPAHVESTEQKFAFVIPKDSIFSFDPQSKSMGLTFSRDVQATAVTTDEHATAAIPTAPLSPIDIARASTLARFYWVALALGLLAGFLFYEAHIKAGVVAAAGAIAVPLLAKFFSSELAQYATLATVCISGALFMAWHFARAKFPHLFVEAVTKTETAIRETATAVKTVS